MRNVIFDKIAVQYLNTLKKDIKSRIYKKRIQTKSNPYHYFERLTGRQEFKLRIGAYRVVADIDNVAIKVRLIGHRKNIYEKI